MSEVLEVRAEWEKDCIKWRGEVLVGQFAHWCHEWDELPVDETCAEFASCRCFKNDRARELPDKMHLENERRWKDNT